MKYWKQLPWIAKTVIACSLLVGLVVFAFATSPTPIHSAVSLSQSSAPVCSPDASALLGLINQERAKLGAPQLVIDPALATSASNKLNDEITNEYYGHSLVDGSNDVSILRAQGINAASSEDLDANALNPAMDWKSFKNSPAHYSSLTNAQYTRVGIANQCVDFTLSKETDSVENVPVGTRIKELTVVHLAGPEPIAPAPQAQTPIVSPAQQCFTTYYPAIHYGGTNIPGYSKTNCN